jgi:hypothetical protein
MEVKSREGTYAEQHIDRELKRGRHRQTQAGIGRQRQRQIEVRGKQKWKMAHRGA